MPVRMIDGDQDLPVGKFLLGPLVGGPDRSVTIDQEDNEGEAIDSGDIRDLDERKIEVLGVAQIRPGETRQKERPEILEGNPEEREPG